MDSLKANEGVDIHSTIIGLAKLKLIGGKTGRKLDSWRTDHHAVAAVTDTRLMLHYEPAREPTRLLQQELVASHMRMAYSIPKHREFFHSGYSSEPILAEAAAQLWDSSLILNHLVQRFAEGFLDAGTRGELTAKLLLTEAYNYACSMTTEPAKPHFSAGCSLMAFMQALIGKSHRERIPDWMPDNIPGSTAKFADVFKNASVRFTHFSKFEDEGSVNVWGMVAGMVRGTAWTGWKNQKIVDILIPVLIDSNEPITSQNTTAVLIQVKRRLRKGSPTNREMDADALSFFFCNADAAHKTPYVTIHMELGLPTGDLGEGLPSRLLSHPTRPPQPPNDGYPFPSQQNMPQPSQDTVIFYEPLPASVTRASQERHPRYRIEIFGCSTNSYGVIAADTEASWRTLLGVPTVVEEHPRHSNAAIQKLLNLKPFFISYKESFNWISLGEEADPKDQQPKRSTDSDVVDQEMTDSWDPRNQSDEQFGELSRKKPRNR